MKRAIVAALTAGAMVVCVAAVSGCSKSTPPGGDDAAAAKANPGTGTGTGTGTNADGATAPGDGGAAEGGAAMGAAMTFVGKYTVTPGTMYVPAEKDWASVKFKNDETKLLGDGEMTIAIDPSGRVSGGTESGPLGPSLLDGTSEKGVVTGTIRRKDPADEGLTGTLVATVTGDVLAGTMKLAESNAAVVREAKLEAKKK